MVKATIRLTALPQGMAWPIWQMLEKRTTKGLHSKFQEVCWCFWVCEQCWVIGTLSYWCETDKYGSLHVFVPSICNSPQHQVSAVPFHHIPSPWKPNMWLAPYHVLGAGMHRHRWKLQWGLCNESWHYLQSFITGMSQVLVWVSACQYLDSLLDIDHRWISNKSIPLHHPPLHLFCPKAHPISVTSLTPLHSSLFPLSHPLSLCPLFHWYPFLCHYDPLVSHI